MLQRVTGPERPLDLEGKTVLIVGATSGIGAAMAYQLAGTGARLVLMGRDPLKLQRLTSALGSKATRGVHTVCADLADLKSIAVAAAEIRGLVESIHVLIANAGVLYADSHPQLTRDGLELTMGVNHFGNAAVILALADLVCGAAPSRIVLTASNAHRGAGDASLDDLIGAEPISQRDFSGLRAYCRSKLANILFARELARRLKTAGVQVYSAHPGVVNTSIINGFARNGFARASMRLVRKLLLTPEQAAQGILRVAADPMINEPSGTYFELGRPDSGSQLSNDPVLAHNLWDETVRLLANHVKIQPVATSTAPKQS